MLLKRKRKDCHIIIDDKIHEKGVEKVLRELEGCVDIIRSENLNDYVNKNASKNLLINKGFPSFKSILLDCSFKAACL